MGISMSKKTFIVLLSVCIFIGSISFIGLFMDIRKYSIADKTYEAIIEDIEKSENKKIENSLFNNTDISAYENLNFKNLKMQYPDIVGWLRSKEGNLNYPIVQTNNNEYYLNHLPNGEENVIGSIFLDCGNSSDFSSSVSVIYGHHVKNKKMFGFLDYYKNQEYYNENPQLYLYTPDKNYTVYLAAGYLLDGTNGAYPAKFDNQKQMKNYLDKIKDTSLFKGNYEIKEGDKLIILSTCSYEFDNARLAIVGLLRESEF